MDASAFAAELNGNLAEARPVTDADLAYLRWASHATKDLVSPRESDNSTVGSTLASAGAKEDGHDERRRV
jgi:hypothetical protein